MKKDDFFQRVYHVVKRIPYGKVTTYGLIAKYLGSSSSARTVGWALNASHNDSSIPAHRVVNRHGLLTGKHHFGGSNIIFSRSLFTISSSTNFPSFILFTIFFPISESLLISSLNISPVEI